MAKILVADDNSNIQKMVGLALKDQGIDVVAVGNGEAAVRKISDVRPDLVLADVFMPVRNGYEVCKYVKGDSSLSHIPVILLVGAFDPLDEEEAQRVGADGVLKKPFVPPDPLISMVKSALVRASTGQLNVPKPSNNEGSSATVASLPGAETVAAMPTQAVPEAEEPVSSRPPDLKIEPGTQAPAFGSLLEAAPAPTETGDYTNFTTPNRELLERDWGTNQEEEEEEEEESSGSWRPDAVTEAFGDAGEPAGKKPEKKKRETWTPTREKKQDLLETADQPEFVSEPIPAKPPATKPSVPPPVAAAPPSAAPVTPPVTAKPPAASAPPVPPPPAAAPPTPVAVKPPAAAPKPPAMQPKPWVEMPPDKPVQPAAPPMQAAQTLPAKQATPSKQAAPPPNQAAPPPKPAPAAPKETEKAPGGSWFSVSSTPWGTDPKHPGQGAPAWDAPTPAAAPPAKPPVQPTVPAKAAEKPDLAVPEAPELEPEAQATGFYTESVTLPELVSGGENVSPAVVEQLRQEATQVVEESAIQGLVESAPEYTLPAPEAPVPAPAAATDMDTLVAKVLAKLSPEVLQAVTREILKPVVEAMVREEIKAKKP